MHARFVRLLRRFVSCLLSGEGSALARTAKTACARRRLRDQVSFEIGDRDHRVVERRCDMDDTVRNVLLFFLAKDFLLSACFCHKLCSLCFVLCALLFVPLSIRLASTCPLRRRTKHKALSSRYQNYFLPGAFFLAI